MAVATMRRSAVSPWNADKRELGDAYDRRERLEFDGALQICGYPSIDIGSEIKAAFLNKHAGLRSGNTGAGQGVVEFMKEALALLPKGMGIRCVRADGGACGWSDLGPDAEGCGVEVLGKLGRS